MDAKENSYLYLVHQFKESEFISTNLKNEKIFKHVYDVKKIGQKKGL